MLVVTYPNDNLGYIWHWKTLKGSFYYVAGTTSFWGTVSTKICRTRRSVVVTDLRFTTEIPRFSNDRSSRLHLGRSSPLPD
jgi:hypothetical protein